jgi:uncharacterized protein YaeQ
MNFLDGIFSFHIALYNAQQNSEAIIRLKAPRHEQEPVLFFYAKIIAFIHSYHEKLQFQSNIRSSEEIVASTPEDYSGLMPQKLFIGAPSTRALKAFARQGKELGSNAMRGYCFESVQVEAICTALKGSGSNWIEPVTFFRIDHRFLHQLSELETGKQRWEVTIVENNHLYLSTNHRQLETDIAAIDIWATFQHLIANKT